MVYLIVCDKMDVCKIGYSINPNGRLSGIQTGYPHKLRIYKVLNAGNDRLNQRLERGLHKRFEDLRLNGEWFHRTKAITSYFDAYFSPIPTVEDTFVGSKPIDEMDEEYVPRRRAIKVNARLPLPAVVSPRAWAERHYQPENLIDWQFNEFASRWERVQS